MLQRAASNAYSWWWASHIRTKQSKWMELNIQDMEEKVESVLKLISEDGDSFAKRAEMYYKKRPELIGFVEESFKAYRALAERYDHISKELQNANNTIASVFPEQVQLAMEEEDEEAYRKLKRKMPTGFKPSTPPPQVPKAPTKDFKSVVRLATKKFHPKKSTTGSVFSKVAKSGLSKTEGVAEIDKLQKRILVLQTEKEFVKNSYDIGVTKYREIEESIKGLQEKVCNLQDEFGEGEVIEDEEARRLMATTALNSCQQTVEQVQEKQDKSSEDTVEEFKRIREAKQKLRNLRDDWNNSQDPSSNSEEATEEDAAEAEVENAKEKLKGQFDVKCLKSLTVSEMAEKIDELVNKVAGLELAVSSETAMLKRLRTEADEVHRKIQILGDDRANLMNENTELKTKLKEMEEKLEKLLGFQELNASLMKQNEELQMQNEELQMRVTESTRNIDLPQESATSHVEKSPAGEPLQEEETSSAVSILNESDDMKRSYEGEEDGGEKVAELSADSDENRNQPQKGSEDGSSLSESISGIRADVLLPLETDPIKISSSTADEREELDWKQLYLNGLQDREKLLLSEYTTTLRNYKEMKQKLSEMEQKIQATQVEPSDELKGLKLALAMKDEEIRQLREKLDLMQRSFDGSAEVGEETRAPQTGSSEEEEDKNLKALLAPQFDNVPPSPIEEKLRTDIDELLEDNLYFWLRFSASFHEIQKFETEARDLLGEAAKLVEKKIKPEGSSNGRYSLRSDARPLYRHLMEIQTELAVWLESSVSLKEEQKSRFSSLCEIQEEITQTLKDCAELDDFQFTSYQAAKFQGEILNMKQENNKVAQELQAGMDHVTSLQTEVEQSLTKLNEEFGLSGPMKPSHPNLRHSDSRNRIPLRSFIFGVKPKKQKASIFNIPRKYNALKL